MMGNEQDRHRLSGAYTHPRRSRHEYPGVPSRTGGASEQTANRAEQLKQFQRKCRAIFRPELRNFQSNSRKSVERFSVRNCVTFKAIPGKSVERFSVRNSLKAPDPAAYAHRSPLMQTSAQVITNARGTLGERNMDFYSPWAKPSSAAPKAEIPPPGRAYSAIRRSRRLPRERQSVASGAPLLAGLHSAGNGWLR